MFPSLNEVINAWNSNKLLGDGEFKFCYEFDDDFVLLVPKIENCIIGFNWVSKIINDGLMKGHRYFINDEISKTFVYLVERVELSTEKKFKYHPLVYTTYKGRREIIKSLYKDWDTAIAQYYSYNEPDTIDLKRSNFGFRENGEPVFFDIVV